MPHALTIFLRYLPVTLVAASVPAIGLIDAAVISTLGEPALIGGIAAAATIVSFLFFTLNFLRTSTTALSAQAAGAGDDTETLAIILRAAMVAAVLGIAAILLQVPITEGGVAALAIDGAVAEAARTYFGVRVWSVPAMLFNLTIIGWLLGQGKIVRAMTLQALTSLLSIALCVVFVTQLGMGVRGAALASVTAETTTAAIGLVVLGRALWGKRLDELRRRVFVPEKFTRLLAVNGNLFLRAMALFVVMSAFTRQSATLGTEILAINAVLINLFFVSASLMDGTATAAQHLTGRAVGARSATDFAETVRTTFLVGTVLACIIAVVLLVAQATIISMLVWIEPLRVGAAQYYLWPVIAQLVGSAAFISDGIFIGATWTRDARNLMILAALVFFAAVIALMPVMGNHGLWLAMVIYLGTRGVFYGWRMRSLFRQTFPAPAPAPALA